MVGLKSVWITISALFLMASCVPQTKQTSCKSNEAFNSALRSCVPVVNGPSSFITIKNPSPTFASTKYKNDSSYVTFSILVSNPYAQTYTIRWERAHNSSLPDLIASDVTSINLQPNSLSTQLGVHVITAKIIDANGTIVDSHNFELIINELPQPTINAGSAIPLTPSTLYPSSLDQQFSFTVSNNNASLNSPSIEWSVIKNGTTTVLSEVDTFTTMAPSGSFTSYLGSASTPIFNPDGPGMGLGSYFVRAIVKNNFVVVAEQNWNITISHPALGKVTGITSPAPGVSITAQHNVDYNDFPTYGWVETGTTTKPGFCVTVNDADGTYAGDGEGVQVKWYLDSLGADICTKETNDAGAATQTICLTDPGVLCGDGSGPGVDVAFNTDLLKFLNPAPALPQNRSVTARVFDKFTGSEYAAANVNTAPFTYPISWTVINNPVNQAPAVTFGAASPTCSGTTGVHTKTNCAVSQGSTYNFGFTVADDFYNPITQSAEFEWDMRLKLAGVIIPGGANCTKALGVAASPVYSSQYVCTVTIPHYGSLKPINPLDGLHTVEVIVSDSGSPVGGLPLASQKLTWELNITETNPGATTIAMPQVSNDLSSHVARDLPMPVTVLDPAGSNYATEGETVIFRPFVSDLERDNLRVTISLCTVNTPTLCTSALALNTGFDEFLRSAFPFPTAATTMVNAYSYPLPENLLLMVSPQHDVNTTTSRPVYFKVDVSDIPSTPIAPKTISERFTIYVRNKNPAPVINTATASPAMGTPMTVYAGYPVTINPGTVTDTSDNGDEDITKVHYKWYARQGAAAWSEIPGATFKEIKYTPNNGAEALGNISLMVCAGDRPLANPADSANAATPQCAGPWTVIPKDTTRDHDPSGIAGSVVNELATFYYKPTLGTEPDIMYSAYIDSGNTVYVEKSVFSSTGSIDTSTIRKVSFDALSGLTAHTVKDLSITADKENVYIAYLASNTSTPTNYVPRIRRIDTNFGASVGTKTNLFMNKFGFSYAPYNLDITSCTACSKTTSAGTGVPHRLTFASGVANGQIININGKNFTAVAAPTTDGQFCNVATCPSGSDAAADLAVRINNSVDPLVQGITAVAVGTSVDLYGSLNEDRLDFDGSMAPIPAVSAIQLGKIFMMGNRWNLPVIIASTLDVAVYSGDGDVHLRSVLPNTANVLGVGKTAVIDSKINAAGELVIARISAETSDAGAITLHRFSHGGINFTASVPVPPALNPQDIFPMKYFESVKLAADTTGNSYVYVLAKERTVDGGAYHIGRYSNVFTSGTEYELENRVLLDGSTVFISDTLMQKPELVAAKNTNEARIFFHSVGAGAVSYPMVAKVKSNMTVSCGSCAPISGQVRASAPIAVSEVVADKVLGNIGSTLNENSKDVVLTLFNIQTAGPTYRPRMGLINIESENMTTSSVDSTNFLYRPSYVKD